jgi:hypothetical protein
MENDMPLTINHIPKAALGSKRLKFTLTIITDSQWR